MSNISDFDIEEGKKLFLKFNNELSIENTKYGNVLKKSGEQGLIYINGVLTAAEDNFLFSYNITFLNASIKKAISRERTNLGRTAYTGMVRQILLECESEEVGRLLSNDLRQFGYGDNHDELKWIDVQNHAAKILSECQKVIFVTPEESQQNDLVNEAKQGGAEVVIIPANLRDKIVEENERYEENKVMVLQQFVQEREDNYEFKFINEYNLTSSEKEIFNKKDKIFQIIGGQPLNIQSIVVSETMVKDPVTYMDADGLWEARNSRIIIKRSVLQDQQRYLGLLLHEIAHAASGAADATRAFEEKLTEYLGILADEILTHNNDKNPTVTIGGTEIDQFIIDTKYCTDTLKKLLEIREEENLNETEEKALDMSIEAVKRTADVVLRFLKIILPSHSS